MRTLKRGQFHGTRLDERRRPGLTLVDAEYGPGHRLPLHAHERPFFSLLLRGTFSERLERGRRDCVPTSLVYYGAHEPHAEAFGERGGRAFNIEFGGRWLAELDERGTTPPPGSTETRGSRLNWLATRLYALFLAEPEGATLELEEGVVEMLAELTALERLGRETTPPPWLARVRERIHEEFDRRLRVGDLADEAGVHPVHLTRVFRRYHGCPVGEYQRRLRIAAACRALAREERVELSRLAFSTGFADQPHFSRWFKAMTGMTPGRYREVVRS